MTTSTLSDNYVRQMRQKALFGGQCSREDVAALCLEVQELRRQVRELEAVTR